MNQNNSMMDSQNAANNQNKSEQVEEQSAGTKNQNSECDKYERMKQVFRFLIEEAPYLIDDKAIERCQNVSQKEQMKIKIDSVRKSLAIEDMDDVRLLVDELYSY